MKNSYFKRFVSTAAAAVCMFTSIRFAPLVIETEADAASGMSAFEITEQMTIGWNLGNTLDAYDSTGKATGLDTETCWGQPKTTQAMIDAVKAKGFNTIRIPTTWYAHLDGNNQIDPAWLARVKEIVDYCMKDNLYVILNVHHEETWINVPKFTDQTYQEAEKKLTAIWTQLAEEFKDYDQHLVFEGMNEPRQTDNPSVSAWGNGSGDNGYTWNYINKLNAKFVETVRAQGSAANKERLLMCPGYCASSDMEAIRAVQFPANSGNVAYSVHAYLPYYFTMADDDKANHSYPGKSGWGEDYTGAINSFFDNLKKLEAEKNIPVVIGEFSSSNFDNLNDRKAWAKDYMTGAKQAGIPCVLWDNNCEVNTENRGEAHGYFNRTALSWYASSEPVIDVMMNVINDDSILWNGHKKAAIKDEPVVTTAAPETTTAAPETTTTAAPETTTAKPAETTAQQETTTTTVSALPATQPATETTLAPTTTEADYPRVYPIDLTGYDKSNGDLVLTFMGACGAGFNGGIGCDVNGEWKTVYQYGAPAFSGSSTVTVPLEKLEKGIDKYQVQIWWSDGQVTFDKFEVNAEKKAETTKPAETATTTKPADTTKAPVTTTTIVTKPIVTTDATAPTTSKASETTTTTAPESTAKGKLAGDANLDGYVSISDAVAILQHIGNRDKYGLKPEGLANADVDGQAGVTGNDALTIQKVDAGIYKKSDLPLKNA